MPVLIKDSGKKDKPFLEMLIQRINEQEHSEQQIENVRLFHDQKSEGAFRVIETGMHTITSQDIKRVAKKDEVVAEKENAIQIRIKEEKDREDELEQDNQTI